MDNKGDKCKICNVTYTSPKDKVLHLEGKKHKRLAGQNKAISCGVFITGFTVGKTKEELLQYFSKFGSINNTHIGPKLNYIILVYEHEREAKRVLDTTHYIDGRKLIVEKRNPVMAYDSIRNVETQDQECMDMLKTIKNFPTLEMQINKFIEYTAPDISRIRQTYDRVARDMVCTFSMVFSHCEVYPFGSSTTSLQFKSSDIDVYVRILNRPESDIDCLREAKKALHQSRLFRNIIGIPAAKIPIIKCVHSSTGVKCDINFRNMLGVKNSQLISYYLSLDPRLRSIMLVLKYWGKMHEITGRNHLFTNYSLALMLIFYLQQKYNFPSVFTLQRHTVPTDRDVIWNMNITQDVEHSRLCKTKNESILTILHDFFLYYSKFQYATDIICPYLGHPVSKQLFATDNIPEELSLYKMHMDHIEPLKYEKPICIQDPFELNVNTCGIIFQNKLERYISLCTLAQSILTEENEKNILHVLFSKKLIETPDTPQKSDPDKYQIFIKMQKQLDYLRRKLDSDDNEKLTEMWYREVFKYVRTVFDRVLMLNLNKVSYNPKNVKLDNQKDVHDSKNSEAYSASCFMNLWEIGQKRIEVGECLKDKLEQCSTELEKDILVSEHIWTKDAAFRPSTPIFECEIHLTCHKDPTRVSVELVRIASYKKIFKAFCLYITRKLPHWFEVYENDLNKNV